jgi:hypothetical protein
MGLFTWETEAVNGKIIIKCTERNNISGWAVE